MFAYYTKNSYEKVILQFFHEVIVRDYVMVLAVVKEQAKGIFF